MNDNDTNSQKSRWRRGLLFAAVAGGCGSMLAGVPAGIGIVNGDDIAAALLIVVCWGGFLGLAGFVIGALQPTIAQHSSTVTSGEPKGVLWLAGRIIYVLVVGILIAMVFTMAAELLWVAVVFAIQGGDLNKPLPSTPLHRTVMLASVSAMLSSAVAALSGSLLGACLGATVGTSDGRPPIGAVAAWAGAVSVLVGSVTGLTLGALVAGATLGTVPKPEYVGAPALAAGARRVSVAADGVDTCQATGRRRNNILKKSDMMNGVDIQRAAMALPKLGIAGSAWNTLRGSKSHG